MLVTMCVCVKMEEERRKKFGGVKRNVAILKRDPLLIAQPLA